MSKIAGYISIEEWAQIHTILTMYRDERMWNKVRQDLSKHLNEVISKLNKGDENGCTMG